jgi:hypothetical protein
LANTTHASLLVPAFLGGPALLALVPSRRCWCSSLPARQLLTEQVQVDDDLAIRMREFINHGENVSLGIGLNLRMPEVCAAIAMVQLRR